MQDKFYELNSDKVNLRRREILLKEVVSNHLSHWGFTHNDLNYERLRFSKEAPNPSYPNSCLYIYDKRTSCVGCAGIHIVNVQYTRPTTLTATKMTGDQNVPSGKPSFRIDMSSRRVEVNFANKGYNRPTWHSLKYSLQSATQDEIRISKDGISDQMIHISQFKHVIAY